MPGLSRLSSLLLAVALPCLVCQESLASTLPVVDFHSRQKLIVSAGLADLSVDVPVSDNETMGITGWIPVLGFGLAARTTLRLGRLTDGITYGLTFSGGVEYVFQQTPISTPAGLFLQPAFDVSVPLLGLEGPLTLRATVGPILSQSYFQTDPRLGNGFGWQFLVWPDLELAWRVDPHNEVTLGGNSLVGWRGAY